MNQQATKGPGQQVFDILRQHARAPAAHDSRTSNEAAAKMTASGRHGTIKRRVYEIIKKHTASGRTDEELWAYFPEHRPTSIVSARNSLCNMRPPLVEHSGRTRKSPTSGMMCTIWQVVR